MLRKSAMTHVRTYPARGEWIACIVAVPALIAIGSIPPLLAVTFLAADPTSGRVPAWGWAVSLVTGAIFAIWMMGRAINRQCWLLTDTELIGGLKGNLRFPLISVERIIIGLPCAWPTAWMSILASSAVREALVTAKAGSVLIRFRDGSMLPLTLQRIPNGNALIEALLARMEGRVEKHYTYSKEEMNRLRRADPNALLRST
jgi:hypothetical protein